ncbi:MAG: N-acetylmuramoyl-L-alanine amidase [Clostridia bacterium]|nr:N-acetylmuramoyl-L-alanine amidase [Clostridia bacterium]
MSIKVYIDQGHNPSGFNTGAEGNGFFEQDITYEVGIRLYDLLASNPEFEARLSRPESDTVLGFNNSTSLVERVRDANSYGADIFISIHTNSAPNPNATGSEALIYSRESETALGLATDILKQLNLVTGLRNRGVIERPGLYVLRRTAMPAVLVEIGFISNRSDAELMAYSPGLFAEGIYRGILEYYGML